MSSDAFVREARDDLRALSDGILELEGSEPEPESVDDLFRTAHSLKSTLRMEGHDAAGELAHAIEDVLDALRDGRVEPSAQVVDATLEATDALDDVLAGVESGPEPDADPEAAAAALREAVAAPDRGGGSNADAAAGGGPDIPDPTADVDPEMSAEEALDAASEFDDLEGLADQMEADEQFEGLEGGGAFEADDTTPTASGGAEGSAADDAAPETDDGDGDGEPAVPQAGGEADFADLKRGVSDEPAVDELESELEEVSFGEFDDEDEMSIQELIDIDTDDSGPEPDDAGGGEVVTADADDAGLEPDDAGADDGAVVTADADDAGLEPDDAGGGEVVAADADDAGPEPDDTGADDGAVVTAGADDAGPEPDDAGGGEVDAATADVGDEQAVGDVDFDGERDVESVDVDVSGDGAADIDVDMGGGTGEPADAGDVIPDAGETGDDGVDVDPDTGEIDVDVDVDLDPDEPEPVEASAIDPDELADLSDLEGAEFETPMDIGTAGDPVESPGRTADEAGGGADPVTEFDRDAELTEFESRFEELFQGAEGEGRPEAAASLAESSLSVGEPGDRDRDPEARAGDERRETGRRVGEVRSITVDADYADDLLGIAEELASVVREVADAIDGRGGSALANLEATTSRLQRTVMDIRLMPLETVTDRLDRVVRDVAREHDREVELVVSGQDVRLDRSIIEQIGDPVVHVVRNAVDHGIEPPEAREAAGKQRTGTIEVRARRTGDTVEIEIEDDGAGIDPDGVVSAAVDAGILSRDEAADVDREAAFDLLFHPGLSTADEVTETSGRGVGMDVVREAVESLNGSAEVESDVGEGTLVRLRVPVSLAITEVLFVRVGDERFAIPAVDVEETSIIGGSQVVGGDLLSAESERAVDLADAMGLDAPREARTAELHLRQSTGRVAVRCDDVIGRTEVVIDPYDDLLADVPGVSGVTVGDDGSLVNVVDVEAL